LAWKATTIIHIHRYHVCDSR